MRLFANPNTFANSPLDRASPLRRDAERMEELYQSPEMRLTVFHNLKPMVFQAGPDPQDAPDVAWLRAGLVEDSLPGDATRVFLGLENGAPYFALDISALPDPENSGPLAGLGTFAEMRGLSAVIPGGDAAILAQAKALIDWHARHGFCSACGTKSELTEAGYKRICPNCGAEHFPRTDPVAIMLATHEGSCLLGRGKAWPPRFFSALAGFLEPGETIEEGVAREIYEEAGLKSHTVHYRFTQPWPFPSSLMIGCVAEVEGREINLDGDEELAEARWFDREELELLMAGRHPERLNAPPPFAIAHQLIKDWLARA